MEECEFRRRKPGHAAARTLRARSARLYAPHGPADACGIITTMLKLLRRQTEHSDSVPLDVIAPVDELRRFLAGEITAEDYDKAVQRGEEALVGGYERENADAEDGRDSLVGSS